jgi:hypothetical protein
VRIFKIGFWLPVIGLLVACGEPKAELADLRSACNAGSAAACDEVKLRERQIEISQQQLYTHPSGATPGCQQGAEGEVNCSWQ